MDEILTQCIIQADLRLCWLCQLLFHKLQRLEHCLVRVTASNKRGMVKQISVCRLDEIFHSHQVGWTVAIRGKGFWHHTKLRKVHYLINSTWWSLRITHSFNRSKDYQQLYLLGYLPSSSDRVLDVSARRFCRRVKTTKVIHPYPSRKRKCGQDSAWKFYQTVLGESWTLNKERIQCCTMIYIQVGVKLQFHLADGWCGF